MDGFGDSLKELRDSIERRCVVHRRVARDAPVFQAGDQVRRGHVVGKVHGKREELVEHLVVVAPRDARIVPGQRVLIEQVEQYLSLVKVQTIQ